MAAGISNGDLGYPAGEIRQREVLRSEPFEGKELGNRTSLICMSACNSQGQGQG